MSGLSARRHPAHLRGEAGCGKTTLAMRLAERLGRPMILVTGDSALTSQDLLGREIGEETRQTKDNFVHSVVKTKRESRASWRDGALTQALEEGATLVFDEFTRAPAEANNALLSALEERIVVVGSPVRKLRQIEAHPEFRAIFTSNPSEYAGTSRAPDALRDRMITFDVPHADMERQIGILQVRSGIGVAEASVIVRIVRDVTAAHGKPASSLRPALMIARILVSGSIKADISDARFVQVCADVLASVLDHAPSISLNAAELRRKIQALCADGDEAAA
ncbi:MAG: AAA family ATPase [Pseudomonadota bacterium]